MKRQQQSGDPQPGTEDLQPCGEPTCIVEGRAKQVSGIHKCPGCGRSMHAFCGRGIGDEGYGQPRQCSDCQTGEKPGGKDSPMEVDSAEDINSSSTSKRPRSQGKQSERGAAAESTMKTTKDLSHCRTAGGCKDNHTSVPDLACHGCARPLHKRCEEKEHGRSPDSPAPERVYCGVSDLQCSLRGWFCEDGSRVNTVEADLKAVGALPAPRAAGKPMTLRGFWPKSSSGGSSTTPIELEQQRPNKAGERKQQGEEDKHGGSGGGGTNEQPVPATTSTTTPKTQPATTTKKSKDRAFRSKAGVEDWLKSFGDKYSSVEAVEVAGEVLVRCQQCHEVTASRSDGDKLTKGIVVIAKGTTTGSIKTNSMDYHFDTKTSKRSFHSRTLDSKKAAGAMGAMLKKGRDDLAEGLICLLKSAAAVAQQEQAADQFASVVALVRSCNGDVFTDPAYENREGFWGLVSALVAVQREELAVKLKASACWGLQVDECTDAAGSSNMILYGHFEENYAPKVVFLGLKKVHTVEQGEVVGANADRLVKMIKDVIDETKGLELSRLMGFASDGASVMVGAENGVAAQLKGLVSELHSAHCIAHREALAAGSAVKRVALAVSIDKLLSQVNSLFAHSTLKKEMFNQAKKALGVNTPGLQTHNTTRFLSRFGSMKAVVLNYGVLLKFTREEGGREVQLKDVKRQQLRLAALQTRLAAITGEASTLDQHVQATWASLQQYPAPGPDASNPEYAQQYHSWHGPTLESYNKDQARLKSLRAEEAEAKRLLAVPPSPAPPSASTKGTDTAASLCHSLEDFRTLGMVHFMCDILLVLSNLNKFFQYRLITYASIVEQLDTTKLKLNYLFAPDNPTEQPMGAEFKRLIGSLGGAQKTKGFHDRLQREPMGFTADFEGTSIFVSKSSYEEVLAAGKEVARYVNDGLVARFPEVELLVNFSVFDPQNIPLTLDEVRGYGSDEIERLSAHYGNSYTNGEELEQEWVELKIVLLKVRKQDNIVRLVEVLRNANARAKKCQSSSSQGQGQPQGQDEDGDEDVLPDEDETARVKRTEAFMELWVTFWREVAGDAGRGPAENVLKLVKLYITLPHSSVESERGFSCQNRIKNKARARLAVPRLEQAMTLSLGFRHDGVDLTSSSSTTRTFLEKAADRWLAESSKGRALYFTSKTTADKAAAAKERALKRTWRDECRLEWEKEQAQKEAAK